MYLIEILKALCIYFKFYFITLSSQDLLRIYQLHSEIESCIGQVPCPYSIFIESK